MTKPATRKGVGDGKAPPDWESIEREYRAGVLSIREIAKRYSVSHVAIQKRARKEKWARDLTEKVRKAVTTALVTTPVTTQTGCDSGNREEQRRTEREIVDDAAAAVVALVREHRADLRDGRELATVLMEQLRMAAGNRDALMDLIEEATGYDPADSQATKQRKDAQRKAMLAAVSLPGHIAALKDLSNVLKNLIPLERQAFNVDDGGPPDRPDDVSAPAGLEMLNEFEKRAGAALARIRQTDAGAVAK